jgi:Ran GTPase-activating protein (RanGAP) involved in mRNA processing and transport
MYIWRNRNRRDRRNNKLDGLFTWGAATEASNTQVADDILRQEGEEIHAGYYHDRIRVVMHEYLGTKNGKAEVQKMINHLDEISLEKQIKAAEEEANATGKKLKKEDIVHVNDAVTKRHNIYEVFRKYDADGGGTLDPDELRVLLDELNVPMSDDELIELFDELDEDGEGGIDFDEFYTWFTAEAENQKKKNKFEYYSNMLTGGVFDGFAKLVMEVEARNLCLDHTVWTATRDAKKEYRIAHPPAFLCTKSHCEESFATWDSLQAHIEDTVTHDEKDREKEETMERFHTVELFLAGPHGRMVCANRLLFSKELASMEVRIRSVEPQPFRPMLLDPENKAMKLQLKNFLVQGYDPKAGVRSGYKIRNMRSQHLCPGRRAEQAVLQDVIGTLMHCRDDKIDIISAPSTSKHAEVVFTWKGFAKKTIELTASFNGWKREALSPYLQIPPPPDSLETLDEDAKKSKNLNNDDKGAAFTKSLTFGRSSIIKNLGPGKYHYRYVIDGEEKLDEHATIAIDPITGIESNIILVINPSRNDDQSVVGKDAANNGKVTALTRALGEQKKGNINTISAHNSLVLSSSSSTNQSVLSLSNGGGGDDDDAMSQITKISKSQIPKVKGLYDNVIHVNNLHTPKALAKKQAELLGLKKVNLRNMSLYDDGAWAFAAFMQNNSFIEELDISYNGIGDDGMQAIGTILPMLKKLHTFKANGNRIGFDGLRYIINSLNNSKEIVHIELAGNNLCDDGAELIGTNLLPMHSNLLELYLDENKIGDYGADQLSKGILRNKILQKLSLSKNLIYNNGAISLANAITSSGSLKSFRINDTPIGPMGSKSMGDMILQNDSLTYIDLSNVDLLRNNDASGYGAIVSGIMKNKVLKHICLRNNGINDMMAIDMVQALLSNLCMDHVDLIGNNIPARWFKSDHYFETKISRKTPSITTRLESIAIAKADPEAKKYIGKPREVDDTMDGKWTWRRKWKKIDRKFEQRRLLALGVGQEDALILIEKEYIDEQLEKYLVGISAFLDNPNCQIFITTVSKLIIQHFYELLLLKPEPPPRDYEKEERDRMEAFLKKMDEEREERKKQKAMSWQTVGKKEKAITDEELGFGDGDGEEGKGDDDDDDTVQQATNNSNNNDNNKNNDSKADKERIKMKNATNQKEIEWDDERFNHSHKTICKCIFLELGANYQSLLLPYEKTEQAFQMLAIPIYKTDLQNAINEMQVPNQLYISFKKFYIYVKTNAKNIVKGNYFARMRVQADLFFRPPYEEAKSIILDSFRYVALRDIRKNYRAQLETPPKFVCDICQCRFSGIKSYERHMSKGENSQDHKRIEFQNELIESQQYMLRRAKWLVTGQFFPTFFELSPDKNLPEDYIPQVFDSMGEEGRPIGTVEPNRVLLVEDVMGDFLQIAYEGTLGWVQYRLPHERPIWRRVLRPACEDVPYFSWKTLRVNTKAVYLQVRDDKELTKKFELKVRLEPKLESEVIGYLQKGQVVESRASVGDWIHIKYENQDCAWIVNKVGGGAHRPPLTRAEKKEIARKEAEKKKKKMEERLQKMRELRAAAAKRRNKGKPVKYVEPAEEVEVIPPGTYGADTVIVLHDQVQRRLASTVVQSPYNPTEYDLFVDIELEPEEDEEGGDTATSNANGGPVKEEKDGGNDGGSVGAKSARSKQSKLKMVDA